MINRLQLKNFKAFAEADIPLQRLTVLVGPNGSGKTSVLEAVRWIGQKLEVDAERKRNPNSSHHDATLRLIYETFLRRSESCKEVSVYAAAGTDNIGVVASGALSWTVSGQDKVAHHGAPGILQLNAGLLRSPSSILTLPSLMKTDGSGLASAMVHLRLFRPARWSRMEASLRTVVPSIQGVRFDRNVQHRHESGAVRNGVQLQTNRFEVQESLVFDTRAGDGIAAGQVSEGTLLVLGLFTFLEQDGLESYAGKVVLIDDLDRGLHPKAQRELIDLLRKMLEVDPDLQIIATTHSPYLVDKLRPEEVLCTALRDDGTAVCAPLTAHPEFERWKDEMLPGELWSMLGEQWVTKLPPAGQNGG